MLPICYDVIHSFIAFLGRREEDPLERAIDIKIVDSIHVAFVEELLWLSEISLSELM
jgi:hypothetical protein